MQDILQPAISKVVEVNPFIILDEALEFAHLNEYFIISKVILI